MMGPLEYAKELIAYDSVSSRSNVDITDWLEQRLRRMGFVNERIDYVDARGVPKANVVAKLGSGVGGVAYFGHTDVVPIASWHSATDGPFTPAVRNGRLYGRGSCDMKGSLACILTVAEELSSSS